MSYFGTDGTRGQFGTFPITPDFLLRLGFGAGRVLAAQNKKQTRKPSVLIGKDTRLSGYVIEAALQAGFNAAGVDVYMLGSLPTPAIAHLVKSFHADMGVVISASHNPYQDNGVKFFSHEGKKISDELQDAINVELDALVGNTDARLSRLADIKAHAIGKSYRVDDAKGRYIEYCKGSFPYHLSLDHLKIVVDCANGAGYSVAPRVLRELGANVIAIHNTPDGININENCGSTHPETLQKAVLEHGAHVGLALDGDGDRIIMVDEKGVIVDGDAILYALAKHLKPAGVVGTLMSNVALEIALKKDGVGFHRAKVGDRYVMQDLEAKGWTVGGEPSGHILCLDKSRTGDAIVAGLQVLMCMAETGKPLSELISGYTPYPQTLINVRLSQMSDPYDSPELVEIFKQAENELADKGRLLIRKSGTEPVIRVMVECEDAALCQSLAERIADDVRRVLA
ncbi:phosphoglucosamine mutase [Moraxella caviae]|uniref:Phosphoglucosamine mutase n=1 Tax=Moraxella caviae TaxID=34060 RepID=A0A1S9ZYN9_9GAMM|nr:phosphoglucosamine mutase [Moraxella caviae]OOR88527.1 phosphoglucosamine mutase [Moraxella caviae]STZ14939.1 Phosphoglucosamine mutase [Moraxella caviae]VEW12687.1 Phosphoglucosamine mutase [Moraxella caviae]